MDFINDISTESVFAMIKDYYYSMTGRQMQIGSDEFAVAATVSYIFGVLVNRFNEMAKQRYINTATGAYLDAIGLSYDVPRPAPVHATCYVSVEVDQNGVGLGAGTFIIKNGDGLWFTPKEDITIDAPGEDNIIFVGVESNDIEKENNIPIGALNEVVTPIAGVTTVANTTPTGGAYTEFPYDDTGDDGYRRYIIEKRSASSAGGPAASYEMRAKETDSRVKSAYCTRFTDSWYVPNKAIIYLAMGTISDAEKALVISQVKAALEAEEFKPVCDIIEVNAADLVPIQAAVRVGLTTENAVKGEAFWNKKYEEYQNILMSTLGKPFNCSELAARCLEPDEEGVRCEYVAMYQAEYQYVPCTQRECVALVLGVTYEII